MLYILFRSLEFYKTVGQSNILQSVGRTNLMCADHIKTSFRTRARVYMRLNPGNMTSWTIFRPNDFCSTLTVNTRFYNLILDPAVGNDTDNEVSGTPLNLSLSRFEMINF